MVIFIQNISPSFFFFIVIFLIYIVYFGRFLQSGEELLTLEGHRNVVYAIAFNNPYGDKIITGSFGT